MDYPFRFKQFALDAAANSVIDLNTQTLVPDTLAIQQERFYWTLIGNLNVRDSYIDYNRVYDDDQILNLNRFERAPKQGPPG